MVFRYINVDYAVASTLADDIDAGIKDVVVTYDIGCQWGKHALRRFEDSPSMPSVATGSLNSFRVAVPKFHIIGHRGIVPSELQSGLHGRRWDDPRRGRGDNLVSLHIARNLVQGEWTSRSPSDFGQSLGRVELAETCWSS